MKERLPFFDGHNDTFANIAELEAAEARDFLERSDRGHIDLPRALEAGFRAGLFAIFTPAPPCTPKPDGGELPPSVSPEAARKFTGRILDDIFRAEAASDGRFRVARTAADVEKAIAGDHLAGIINFEGAEVLREDLSNLDGYYKRGLRSLGLVWSRRNAFAEGVPFRKTSPDTGPGLTAAGEDLVRAANDLGVLIDLAHINLRGFMDVAEISKAPLVASHTAVYSLCPHTRNLTDEQIDAVAASGGVVGVIFSPGFINIECIEEGDVSLDEIVAHFDYIASRVGVDYIGFGSDFDGARMPSKISDVTGVPRLIDALRGRGYSEEDLVKIAYGNWLRVIRETWRE